MAVYLIIQALGISKTLLAKVIYAAFYNKNRLIVSYMNHCSQKYKLTFFLLQELI